MSFRHNEMAALAERFGSPIYIFDQERFGKNLEDFQAAFMQRHARCIIGYSFKTNYVPYLCQSARRLGAFAEVVSRLELDLALSLGFPPSRIIFNGPLKGDEDLRYALEQGMIVNLDTFYEVEEVCRLARHHSGADFRVGLRVNIELTDHQGNSHIQEGRGTGRFGFPAAGIGTAVEALSSCGVQVCSLHGHTSSASRSLWVYQTIARTLVEIGSRHTPHLTYLNIGGGMFGRPVPAMGLNDTPGYDEYAEVICTELSRHAWFREQNPWLVLEPGMALVADTFTFLTRVFEVKRIGGKNFAVVDGSIFNVKPTMHRRNHPYQSLHRNSDGPPRRYDIVGATCMEKDCLLEDIECPELERGDFLRIDNVGAYTIVMTPPFIHPAPPILVREGEEYRVIRRRQDFADVFGTYTF